MEIIAVFVILAGIGIVLSFAKERKEGANNDCSHDCENCHNHNLHNSDF